MENMSLSRKARWCFRITWKGFPHSCPSSIIQRYAPCTNLCFHQLPTCHWVSLSLL